MGHPEFHYIHEVLLDHKKGEDVNRLTLNMPLTELLYWPKVAGSTKKDGTKCTALAPVSWPVNWVAQPCATEPCPNVQLSPAKVEAKTRPLYLNWFGWLAYVVMYVRRAAASDAAAHGKDLA